MKHPDWRSRFWSKVDMSNREGCWEWQGAISKNGYGSFGLNGRAQTASRLAYWIANGEYPGKQFVLHKCDNRKCVNPAHLYLGDVKQNSKDMVDRGRWRGGDSSGSKNGNAKLTEADIVEIRKLIAAGYNNKQIAKTFGVTHQMISKIRLGHFWKKVESA